MEHHVSRKPGWLKIRPATGSTASTVRHSLEEHSLHTVCEEARCPNKAECWSSGTATFMILGDVCTRSCRFCNVTSGSPSALAADEPRNVARAAKEMDLTYVVLTSVDRDDLADQGAGHFAECIRVLKKAHLRVEALVPDFQGKRELLAKVVAARPDVLGHNVETVKRLTPRMRDRRAGYGQSLDVLRYAKSFDSTLHTKSSLLLGLGETEQEILEAMADLRSAGVDILVLGQYLQPSRRHLPVERYVPPEEFESLRKKALELGFTACIAGPLARTSYKAAEIFLRIRPG